MSDGFGIEPKVYKGNGTNKVYSGVAVFRSGTFRDSAGTQNTWEPLHMRQMMDNYNHLRSRNILQSVPARDGHPGWLINNIPGKGAVVGWHQNLKVETLKSPVDGAEYDYLLADYEITEPYALEKINNGTWRNRSAEIGDYTTNNETEFWPVYMGFAFVDFPAVEGLNFSSSQGRFYAFIGGTSREIEVTQPNSNTGAAPQLPLPVLPAVPAPQTQSQAPSAAPAAPFVFSMGGQNVTDPNAVQAYIRQMETFVSETRAVGRREFVASLVSGQKITTAQQPGLEQFALSLSDEQYTAWKAQWDLAPTSSLLGNHAGGTATGGTSATSVADQELTTAEEVVKMHERGGFMSTEQIKKTSSYQKLVAAGKRPA
jgi:hypothetical protein